MHSQMWKTSLALYEQPLESVAMLFFIWTHNVSEERKESKGPLARARERERNRTSRRHSLWTKQQNRTCAPFRSVFFLFVFQPSLGLPVRLTEDARKEHKHSRITTERRPTVERIEQQRTQVANNSTDDICDRHFVTHRLQIKTWWLSLGNHRLVGAAVDFVIFSQPEDCFFNLSEGSVSQKARFALCLNTWKWFLAFTLKAHRWCKQQSIQSVCRGYLLFMRNILSSILRLSTGCPFHCFRANQVNIWIENVGHRCWFQLKSRIRLCVTRLNLIAHNFA